ncbi:cell division protein FtsW [Erysipelothrix larvae]|uniref:Cell division protein FtsW n=1 Tax=Erysipelothrix larvae TaxID=1514105 RepID=A0A109UGB2_9FIRM|nr:FtsW/RodA/SpoVE family cell cycle protein [Erysipelothrix larvae]AMC92447.1 cell division protein FtsW [Erysipelothrix larvae]
MTNRFNESRKKFTLDWILVSIIAFNGLLGIIGIYLAAPLNNGNTSADFIIRQLFWFAVSIVLVYIILKMGTDRLFTLAYPLYFILMILLFFQVLASKQIITTSLIPWRNGAYAWYDIPGIGSFQPSEFMKIVLLLIGANIIMKHNEERTKFSFKDDVKLLMKLAVYVLPALIFIFLQPDTGVPIIIVISFAVMFFMSGVRREWFIIIGSAACVVFFGIIYLYYNDPQTLNALFGGSGTNYRLDRFYGWLDFEKYSIDQGHQLYRAISSIGTAGWTGHPLKSVVLVYPESRTDFIFAVLAQNFGFMGAVVVIVACFSLDLRLAYITYRSDLMRERTVMAGVLGLLIFQHFQNIGMVVGLLPITGITLPLISQGGSSLVSYMIPFAIAFHMYSEIQNAHQH